MRTSSLTLAACALALVLLLFATTFAAAGYFDRSAPPAAAVVEPGATLSPPTEAASPPHSTDVPPTPQSTDSPPQEQFPLPSEAVASTKARAVGNPGFVPRHQPTPMPDRPTIILDPGHGRGDPGAVHHTSTGVDLTEADSNLSIAEHMRAFLEEKGYDVYVTRSGFGRPLGSKLDRLLISADLMARVRLAAAVSGDLFISIHSNGSPNPGHAGVEIWYCGKHAFGAQSARLAGMMLDAAMQGLREYGYEATRRGTQEDTKVHRSEGFCQFLVTREVRTPAVLTELLFLTNDADAAVLKDDRAREAMALRMAEAIDVFVREQKIGTQ